MNSSYIDELLNYLKRYEGEDIKELFQKLNIQSNAKSKNYMLAMNLIYHFQGKALAEAKIKKDDILVKTISLTKSGKPKEAMSFTPIQYKKIVHEKWENSTFRKILENTFIFFVFQALENGETIIKKIFKYNVPIEDLDGEIQLVWKDTQKKIKEGNIVLSNEDKLITNFICEEVGNICHVRPHGQNSEDLMELPVADRVTGKWELPKVSFWFNHKYLERIVNNN